jgi:hypothetical protein
MSEGIRIAVRLRPSKKLPKEGDDRYAAKLSAALYEKPDSSLVLIFRCNV